MSKTNTYFEKRVFVTGHTGFKGAWLVFLLNELGADIKGYALPPTNDQKLYDNLNIESCCNSVFADVRDAKRLEEEVLNFQPDYVFHFAAQPIVLEAYENPVSTFETNIMGTTYLLDALRKLKQKCNVIIATTDKVYRNSESQISFKETDSLGGYDPYSSSKSCADIVTQSYRNSYFNPKRYDEHQKAISIVRSGNVIGGGDWSENRIVPDLFRAIEKGVQLKIRNPKAIRPWLHVLDSLNGYLMLGAKMMENPVHFSDDYNFGPLNRDCISVEELCKRIIVCKGTGSYEIIDGENEKYEAQNLKLDSSKANEKIGWSAKLSIDESIELTVNWHDENNVIEATKKQVNNFFELDK